jgi:hypothetical protein
MLYTISLKNATHFYTVTVNSQPIDCAFARVSAIPFNTPRPRHQRDISQTEEAAFCSFEGNENITIKVKSSVKIKKAVVRVAGYELLYLL